MLIGYACISTEDQNLDLQRDALANAGCDKVFSDRVSGAKIERPGLQDALGFLREGDTLVIWKLDCLGRSLSHLIECVQDLEARSIGFRSLTKSIDTTTSGGRLIFHVFGALAEFERNIIRELTRAGLNAARARGRLDGRPPALTGKKLEFLKTMFADKSNSIEDICDIAGISRATLYRYLKQDRSLSPSS